MMLKKLLLLTVLIMPSVAEEVVGAQGDYPEEGAEMFCPNGMKSGKHDVARLLAELKKRANGAEAENNTENINNKITNSEAENNGNMER